MTVCGSCARRSRFWSWVSPLLAILALCGTPGTAAAQDGSHWGVGFSVTPQWKSMERPLDLFWGLDGTGTLEGSEFTVGVLRGSTRGGDWGVNFVNKRTKDSEPIVKVGDCEPQPCTGATTTIRLRGVKHTGVEFVWSPTFVTIADRVQIGISVGGGIANTKGEVEETVTFPPTVFNGVVVFPGFQDTAVRPAADSIYKQVPLIRFEIQGGVIVAPGLKLKLAGGFNAPGRALVRIGAVYLVGAQ